jgi:hypothetical protein
MSDKFMLWSIWLILSAGLAYALYSTVREDHSDSE